MCGLVGIAGALAFKDEATMKRLFLLDYFRGPDSTGLAAIRDNGDAHVAKIASHPLDLFEFPKFKSALNGNASKAFIGHNRAATRGAVSTYNAHPYSIDHIVGAHNGTLDYKSVQRLEDAVGTVFPVDSMALFAAIAKLGVKAAIELCETGKDSTTGAWSLVWYDQIEGTLNFLRNKHRPLWYAYSEDFKQMFWASEWPMIAHALQMSGQYKLYAEPKTNNRYWATEEDTHYKIDVDVLKAGSTNRPKLKAKKIEGREPVTVVNAATGTFPFQRPAVTSHGTTTTSPSTGGTTGTGKSEPVKALIHLYGSGEAPFAGYMSYEKFCDLAAFGCSWCQGDVKYDDRGVTIYERDDIILCTECSGHRNNDVASTRIIVPPSVIEAYK